MKSFGYPFIKREVSDERLRGITQSKTCGESLVVKFAASTQRESLQPSAEILRALTKGNYRLIIQ